MRWSIRYQLLIPLILLIVVVVGLTTWTALAAADRARHQIESQMRGIVRTVHEGKFPLAENVLPLIKGLSGADLLFEDGQHRWTTLNRVPKALPPTSADADHWEELKLEQRVTVGEVNYLCCGVVLKPRIY